MRMDKLTSRFQQALADAQSLALGRDHQFMEPAHVMLALLDSSGGSVRPLLMKAGADVNKLRDGVLALLDSLPKVEGTPTARSPRCRTRSSWLTSGTATSSRSPTRRCTRWTSTARPTSAA